MKLNLGCGFSIKEGWVNIDAVPLDGVDIVCDLETVKEKPIDLPDESVDMFLLSHILEHIRKPLDLMQELWRLAKPKATAVIRVPYGSSDDAWEDQTHVRPYFIRSFGYFSQSYYHFADYGYRGDWLVNNIILFIDKAECEKYTPAQMYEKIDRQRNIVKEMHVELTAVKPAGERKKELQADIAVNIQGV